MSKHSDLQWSDDFLVLDVGAPLTELQSQLGPGGPRHIVLRRAPDRMYVFLADELKQFLLHHPLVSHGKALEIADVIVLHEDDSSFRMDQSDSLLDTHYSMPRRLLPTRERYVKMDDRSLPTAVGKAALEHTSFQYWFPELLADSARKLEPATKSYGLPKYHAPEITSPAASADGDEGCDPVRYPSVTADRQLTAGQRVVLAVDLLRVPTDEETRSSGVTIEDLPGDWTEVEVTVEVVASAIDFESTTGTVRVRRNDDSVPARFNGVVRTGLAYKQPIKVVALFSYAGRDCGLATRTFRVGQPLAADPSSAPTAPLVVETAANTPDLTVRILCSDRSALGAMFWILSVPRKDDVPGLPDRLSDMVNLGNEPAEFAESLYSAFGAVTVGGHKDLFLGMGEKLWQYAPEVFRRVYWALREARGPGFSIQFVTDEPYIPWELMRPYDESISATASLLALEHPVARWIADYEGALRQRLPRGCVISIVPNYPKKNDELKHAQAEAELLRKDYDAKSVPGTLKGVKDLLRHGLAGETIAVIHFAGHGRFSLKLPDTSSIKLEDGTLVAAAVGTREVKLGEHDGSIVVFNACEVGATAASLGATGGWADVFLRRRFRGFVAPLWPVYDDHAVIVIQELFEAVVRRGKPLGHAMQQIRARHADESPTFLAYLYYGDVLACMPPPESAAGGAGPGAEP